METTDFDINQAKTAPLLRRLGAMLYDAILLIAILMIAVGLVAIPYKIATGANYYEAVVPLNLMRLYIIAVIGAFYVYFWTRGGQSLGMQAWRIRAIGDDGAPLSTGRAINRFLWSLVSIVPAGWGLWLSLFDRDGLAWHDRKSKSRLVMLKKPERKKG